MKILKFGGTSVGSSKSLQRVLQIVKDQYKKDKQIIVVVSAFAGVTNQLLKLCDYTQTRNEKYQLVLKKIRARHKDLIKDLPGLDLKNSEELIMPLLSELAEIIHGTYLLRECSPRTKDLILSFGERLSATIISSFFAANKVPADYCDARSLIITDDQYGGAHINTRITNKKITEHLSKIKKVQVVTGFISATKNGITTTLGRDGSDYSATVFAFALNADEIQIWTDVNGVMTSNPSFVPNAFPLDHITYEEAMELSHFGAKVLHPPMIQPAFEKNIPIRICNTFDPSFQGTVISKKKSKKGPVITGLTAIEEVALLTVQGSGMVGVPGIAARLFSALAEEEINVIVITQASSEHSICVAVNPKDAKPAKEAIEKEFHYEIKANDMDSVQIEKNLSIIAVVGKNMRRLPGISGKIFYALGLEDINVVAISQGSSELNISVIVEQKDQKKALNVIHESFYPSIDDTLQIYLAGVGLIGAELIKQIEELKHPYLKICGLTNSKKMFFSDKGIHYKTWQSDLLEKSRTANIKSFAESIIAEDYPKKVFVDCTANEEVASIYETLLNNDISVVAANKIAKTQSYKQYRKLKDLANATGLHLNYETNVGAGLPVIETLQTLLKSGDEIIRIEAILSGTLSYLFNSFVKGSKFSEIVKQAKDEGFTEPDPRIDLSGMDVARKILILARESGADLELKDINVKGFLPESCIQAKDVQSFFKELEKNNDYFDNMLKKADRENKVLRYIAKYEKNAVEVGLQKVGPEHPFYFLSGSDNILAFTTKRYNQTALVVKGPGAGAEVTAAGVLADVLKIFPKKILV